MRCVCLGSRRVCAGSAPPIVRVLFGLCSDPPDFLRELFGNASGQHWVLFANLRRSSERGPAKVWPGLRHAPEEIVI